MGFTCSISQDVMQDPVVAADGHSYERASITVWLENNDTSPFTSEKLEHKRLTSNHNLKSQIQTWLEIQAGAQRAEKRHKTSAAEISKFLQSLAGLVRAHDIVGLVQGLHLGDDLKLHKRILDELCKYTYGGKEACDRLAAGGGLQASVATIKKHARSSVNAWEGPCLDACSILQMVLQFGDRGASVFVIDQVGGVQAVVDLVKGRHTEPVMLMRALFVLRCLMEGSTVADRVVGDVLAPILKAMEACKRNLALLASACTTLGELARDGEGRKTEENVARIAEAGGVRAVVRAVDANISGGARDERMSFLVCACRALALFVMDLKMRQSEEAPSVMQSLCSVIRTYPTHDEVAGVAMAALQVAGYSVCVTLHF